MISSFNNNIENLLKSLKKNNGLKKTRKKLEKKEAELHVIVLKMRLD